MEKEQKRSKETIGIIKTPPLDRLMETYPLTPDQIYRIVENYAEKLHAIGITLRRENEKSPKLNVRKRDKEVARIRNLLDMHPVTVNGKTIRPHSLSHVFRDALLDYYLHYHPEIGKRKKGSRKG